MMPANAMRPGLAGVRICTPAVDGPVAIEAAYVPVLPSIDSASQAPSLLRGKGPLPAQVARCPAKTPTSSLLSYAAIGREKCTLSRSHSRLPCHSQR